MAVWRRQHDVIRELMMPGNNVLIVAVVAGLGSIIGRGLLDRYGQSIGAGHPAFLIDEQYANNRHPYQVASVIYTIYGLLVGIGVIFVGLRYMLDAVMTASVPLGLLATLIEVIGLGLLAQGLIGRRMSGPQIDPNARAADQPASDGDKNVLTDIVGQRSEKHRASRFYNIRSYIVWGTIILTVLVYLLFFAPFVYPE